MSVSYLVEESEEEWSGVVEVCREFNDRKRDEVATVYVPLPSSSSSFLRLLLLLLLLLLLPSFCFYNFRAFWIAGNQ